MNQLNQVKVELLAAPTGAGTSDVDSAVVDMQGYEGVIFLTRFGTAAANNSIKVQQGQDSGLSDAADLTGTSVVSGSSDEGCGVDIHKPLERYLRIRALRGTSSTLGEIWAIKYGSRVMPRVSALSGTLNVETHVSPAEGTA